MTLGRKKRREIRGLRLAVLSVLLSHVAGRRDVIPPNQTQEGVGQGVEPGHHEPQRLMSSSRFGFFPRSLAASAATAFSFSSTLAIS